MRHESARRKIQRRDKFRPVVGLHKRGVVVASCVKADWAGEVAKLPELLAADGVCGFDSSALDLPAHLPEKPQIELNAQKGIAKAFSWSCLCMPLACLSIGAGMAVLVVFCGIWFGWW